MEVQKLGGKIGIPKVAIDELPNSCPPRAASPLKGEEMDIKTLASNEEWGHRTTGQNGPVMQYGEYINPLQPEVAGETMSDLALANLGMASYAEGLRQEDTMKEKMIQTYTRLELLDDAIVVLYADHLAALEAAVTQAKGEAACAYAVIEGMQASCKDLRLQIADLTEKLRLSGLRGDSLDRVVGECVQTEIRQEKEIAALQAENERLNRYQAVCHCGALVKDHGFQDGHTAVPMTELCPYAERVAAMTIDIVAKREQIAALTAELKEITSRVCNSNSCSVIKRKIALTAKNEKLRDRLKAAEDVVSYLVIWGASPTDRLVELVEKSMTLRIKDKRTLCIPSAVKDALKEVT